MKINNALKALGPGLVAALALLVTVGLIGIVLVVTASLDVDSNRNNLGVGLLTAAGIGVALISIEYAIDLRRAKREEEIAKERRNGFIESARLSVAALVIDHAEQLAMMLMSTSALPDSKAQPTGCRGESDKSLLVRGLMWAAELPRQNATWWRVPRNIAAVDAIFVLATDIAERSFLDVTAEDDKGLSQSVNRSLTRISRAAERLSQSGDPFGAHELDKLTDVLSSGKFRWELPDLGSWGTETLDSVIIIGGPTGRGHFHKMRCVVAYLIDRLRTDDALLSPILHPNEDNLQIVMKRRWAPLFEDSSSAPPWDDRFNDEGWGRKLLDQTSTEIRVNFGLTPSGTASD